MNKYVWIEPITAENKVGSLFVVNHSQNSYQLGVIMAVADCAETEGLRTGSTVLYDTLGSVVHRVGKQSITTVKAANILGVIEDTLNAAKVISVDVSNTSIDQVSSIVNELTEHMKGKKVS